MCWACQCITIPHHNSSYLYIISLFGFIIYFIDVYMMIYVYVCAYVLLVCFNLGSPGLKLKEKIGPFSPEIFLILNLGSSPFFRKKVVSSIHGFLILHLRSVAHRFLISNLGSSAPKMLNSHLSPGFFRP